MKDKSQLPAVCVNIAEHLYSMQISQSFLFRACHLELKEGLDMLVTMYRLMCTLAGGTIYTVSLIYFNLSFEEKAHESKQIPRRHLPVVCL